MGQARTSSTFPPVASPAQGAASIAATRDGVYRFDGFELSESKAELRHQGVLIALSSQSFALLSCLLRRANCVVSREEISAELWAGVAVSDGSLRQAIWEVRQVLGDDAEQQRFIKTVRGSGYRFVAQLEQDAAAPAPEHTPVAAPSTEQRGTFHGRDAELAQLSGALHMASQAGRACVVLGAPGMGKSRLVRELLLTPQARALNQLESHADSDGMAPPFWPFLQLLGAHLERADAAAQARYRKLAPQAFRLLSGEPGDERLDELINDSAAQHRFQLLTQLSRLFIAISNDAPGVWLMEDLQWADEGTLALLTHLSPLLPQTRVLLLITCRVLPAKENRPLSRTLEALARAPLNHTVELHSLSEEQVRRLLELHAPGVSDGLCREVHVLGGGNPLLTLELSRLLAEQTQDGTSPLASGQIEARTVIRQRLYGLHESTREVAMAASVLGAELSLAELAHLLEQPLDVTLSRLDPCIDAGLLVEDVGRARFQFAHPVMREVAYQLLPRARRARLHRLAGEHIEGRNQDASVTRLNELAHHFFSAASEGVAMKAVVYAVRCAERAYAATTYQEAVAHYDRALSCSELCSDMRSAQKLELELARGEALRATGFSTAKVNQLFLTLIERADSLNERKLYARAVLGYTGQRALRFTPTRFPATTDTQELYLLERALDFVGPEPSELRALLLCSLVYALVYSTDRVRRERAAGEAIAAADALGIPWVRARILAMKFYGCATPDDTASRLTTGDAMVEHAHRHRLLDEELDARVSRAICLLGSGNLGESLHDEAAALELAEQIGTQRAKARAQLPALLKSFCQGDLATTERLTQLSLDASANDLTDRGLFMIRSASLRMLRHGVVPEAIALQQSLLDSYPDGVGFRCVLASAHATMGNREAAMAQFDWVARDNFRRLPEDINWLSEMGFLADAAAQLDDKPRAALVFERLLPHRGTFAFFVGEAAPAGPMAHWLAELAITLERYDDANQYLADAQRLNEQLGATLFMQYGKLARARMYVHGKNRQRDKARRLLEEVSAYGEAHDSVWFQQMAERLAKRFGIEERADRTGPHPLVH